MILSNRSIEEAINEGRLVITPTPVPLPSSPEFDDNAPYKTSSVELRLGNELTWLEPNPGLNINLAETKFSSVFNPSADTYDLNDHPFTLKPGKFILARTLEHVHLPIQQSESRSLAARVEGKSSYARCGILVHFTAPTIHTGFKGHITLELKNLGPVPVVLEYGVGICQLIIEEVKGIPIPRNSQFQNQVTPSGSQKRIN